MHVSYSCLVANTSGGCQQASASALPQLGIKGRTDLRAHKEI